MSELHTMFLSLSLGARILILAVVVVSVVATIDFVVFRVIYPILLKNPPRNWE